MQHFPELIAWSSVFSEHIGQQLISHLMSQFAFKKAPFHCVYKVNNRWKFRPKGSSSIYLKHYLRSLDFVFLA